MGLERGIGPLLAEVDELLGVELLDHDATLRRV
jgi:hypothetical protein